MATNRFQASLGWTVEIEIKINKRDDRFRIFRQVVRYRFCGVPGYQLEFSNVSERTLCLLILQELTQIDVVVGGRGVATFGHCCAVLRGNRREPRKSVESD